MIVLGLAPQCGQFEGFPLGPVGGLLQFHKELANFEQCPQLGVILSAVPMGHECGKADGELGDHRICQGLRETVVRLGSERLLEFLDVFAHVGGAVEEFAME